MFAGNSFGSSTYGGVASLQIGSRGYGASIHSNTASGEVSAYGESTIARVVVFEFVNCSFTDVVANVATESPAKSLVTG